MRHGRPRRRFPRTWMLASVIVVAGLAVGGWWYLSPPAGEQPAKEPVPVVAAKPTAPKPAERPTARPRPGDTKLVADVQPAGAPKPVGTRGETPLTGESPNAIGLGADAPPATQPSGLPRPSATSQPFAGKEFVPPGSQPALATGTPPSSRPTSPGDDPTAGRVRNDARSGNTSVERGRALYASGQAVEARKVLSDLLRQSLREDEAREVRSLLTRIADETIFGAKRAANDPLVEDYTVQSGDVLLNIGKKFGVPAEGLMLINGIKDARTLRAGQHLKVVRGPFHARISKSAFRLDIYLGDTYIRSYRVGLGTENGTPEGTWKVKNRLSNPTYYPPASSNEKRIIAADDPKNPLGEHWIGLEGASGGAVGREGYGIHGTIEPESIGKAVSMGCVRMLNEEVAVLFGLLTPGQSTVTIVP